MMTAMSGEGAGLGESRVSLVAIVLWAAAAVSLLLLFSSFDSSCSAQSSDYIHLAFAAASLIGAATFASLWKARTWLAVTVAIALAAGSGAGLWAVGLFSWVHSCAN